MMIINRVLMLLITFIMPFVISKHVDRAVSKVPIIAATLCYWCGVLLFSENEKAILIAIIFGSMIIVEIFIDYWTQDIIPVYIYGAMILSGILHLLFNEDLLGHLFNSVLVFLGYYVLYILARWYYKEEAFGFGDVLLILGIGFFMPKDFLILASLLPFYLALIHLIFLKILGHKLDRSLKIPFGPYIGVSAIILYFVGDLILKGFIFVFMR
ncbi:prepilin peptidase [Fusibacter sp. 3D3]|uniref:prepilin peptidase n=1 Tax=Fusibacter sp. 3D3 TaxID=1048380 RepID=UPI000853739B|nr:prepilin peptidase [Fusibacter sp. 3D3]GAU79409.1 hypothetical protein F3D3_4070 [Fusibacter sp. 3D3]